MQDSLDEMCVKFHDQWQGRCGQLLQASFPKTKFWKSLNKSMYKIDVIRAHSRLTFLYNPAFIPWFTGIINLPGQNPSQEPGSYCNLLIEELLLPAVEAARGIADHSAQLAFLLLTVNVFLSKLRKTITANRHIYR